MLPALIIFLLTYLLMLVLPQYRPFAALGGAALFLALGAAGLWDFTLMDAARAVDFNVLLMMTGTMGTVSLFIESRMPARLAELLIVRVPNVKWAVCMLAACQFDTAEPKARVPERQQKNALCPTTQRVFVVYSNPICWAYSSSSSRSRKGVFTPSRSR